jgi:hypothetical protein
VGRWRGARQGSSGGCYRSGDAEGVAGGVSKLSRSRLSF